MIRQVIIGGRDMSEHISRVVATAPPLKPQQLAQLRLLLTPSPVDATITTVTPRQSARPRANKAA